MVLPLTFSTRPLTAADLENARKNSVVLSSQPGVRGSAELQQRSPEAAKNSTSDTLSAQVTGLLDSVKNQPWFKDLATRPDNAIQKNNVDLQVLAALDQSYKVSKYV
jgi:hypothetical protein